MTLTAIALCTCFVLMAVVSGIDAVYYKLLGARQLRKWGLA